MFATSLLFRFMQDPSENHFKAIKRVIRYIKGIEELGIWFRKSIKMKMIGFSNRDWASSYDDMKSTSSYVFSFSPGIFSWN